MASRRDGPGPRGLLAPPLLLLLLPPLLAPWPAAGHGGKYSREKNEPERPPQREPAAEFRMEKLNQLWDKAQRLQLSPVDLSELHADLKIQERDEFAWKKLKAEGLDEDGEKEAKLIRNLNEPLPPNERVLVRDPLQPHPACGHISPPGNGLQVLAVKLVCDRDHAVILAKYRLDGRKDARALSSNSLTEGPEQDSLEDPRLEKLWHKAKTSGKFSRDELDKLWREFQHHREKVQEYNVLLETLSRTEEIQENAINPSDMRRAQEEVLHSRHAELKDRLRRINQGYDRLRKVSHQGYGAEAEFEEPRVIDLWDLAQSANFSEKELEAFREELKHFEVKIEKHNHYQKQLEISHQKLRHVERFGDHEHLSRNKERYALLEEKTKELGYKVKKHLQDLSGRISRARHNEL